MPPVRIICLANSRKHGGRCVAGLRVDGGGWVRPVGDTSDRVLYPWHYVTTDGKEPQVLDVLEIDLASPAPELHQPENWLMNPTAWKVIGHLSAKDIVLMLRGQLVPGPALFGTDSDRVSLDQLHQSPARSSLALVVPRSLMWRVSTSPVGKRQVRALFKLGSATYKLSITDPVWEERLSRFPPGDYLSQDIGLRADDTVLLTISLGEPFPFDNCCYKLVAAVIVLPPVRTG